MKIAFVLWLCLAIAESCPDNCKCSKYKIFCKDSRIRSLPKGLPTTQTLSMDGDILDHLNASVFLSNHGLRNLTTLVLINLQIQDIQNGTFAALRNLEFLKITYNNLSHLWPGTFIGLDKLYHLDLSHNDLWSLSFGSFAELRALRHLNLSFNNIVYLHHKMFRELSREEDCKNGDSLKSIDIQGNRMFSVLFKSNVFVSIYCVTKVTINPFEREDFSSLNVVENFHSLRSIKGSHYYMSYGPLRGLYQLTYFNISHSNILRIPGTFLPDSQNLKILWIRQGEIDHLVSNFFHGLFHLSNLNLHGNALEYLEDNIFQDLRDLKYLTLSENNLTSINNNTFNGLARLRYLNLDHNRLSIIQQNSFSHMPQLKELILAGNEFVCFLSEVFSDLPSLKILQLPKTTNCTMRNETLQNFQRLDTFEGPRDFEIDNMQVLKSLKLTFTRSLVLHDFQKYLKQITYLSNPITLEIIDLEASDSLNFLAGINIPSLTLTNFNTFVLKNSSLVSFPNLKSLTIDSRSNTTFQQNGLKNLQDLEDLTLYFSTYDLELEAGIFIGLDNLKKLSMRCTYFIGESIPFDFTNEYDLYFTDRFDSIYNGQYIFTRNIFDGLKKIQQIIIRGFNITTISGYFDDLHTLEILILNNNNIHKLTRRDFLGLKKLKVLDLSNNRIRSIGTGVFGAICNEDFTLTCANLTHLSKYCDTSYVLENLEYLNLEKNDISTIHQQAFLGCNKLKSLNLNYNGIVTIDFLYFPQLITIQLEISMFNTFSKTMFTCTPALEDVSFYSGYIEGMELSAFKHLRYLKRLILPSDTCDCSYRNIWQWMRNRNIQYRQPNTLSLLDRQLCDQTDMDVYLSKLECNYSSVPKFYKPENTTSTSNEIYYFKTYVEPIVLIFIFLTGSFGNGLVLYVIISHSDMRNKKNACIAQLAFAEILSLSLNIALSYWDVANNTWQLNETSCKVFIMSKDLAVSLVVFTVLALTLERYLVVRASFKLKYYHAFKDFGPTLLLVTVWIYSVVTSIPSYVSATLYNRCLPSPPGTDYEKKTLAFQLTVNSIIPVFLIIVLNIATAYMLKKSIDKMPGEFLNKTRDNKRNTVANMVTVLSVVFTLSYLPNAILRTLVSWFSWSVWTNEDIFWYSLVSYCLFFMHTIINPFAILIMGSKFRTHILEIISFFKNEKVNVSETPEIQKSMKGPCQFLLLLGEGLAGTRNASHGQKSTLSDDPEADEEAVRRARQERLNSIQERFRLKF